jgi:hypothetical protein
MKKAQMFSGELLAGFLLFLAAVILILSIWNTTTREVLTTENDAAMEEMGSDMAEKLLRTPGNPENWVIANVTSLGLSNQSRVLMRDKVLAFVNMTKDDQYDLCNGERNYECNIHRLGIGGYNFYFNMTDLNGSAVEINNAQIISGRAPENETRSVTIERTGILDDKIVRIYITMWA